MTIAKKAALEAAQSGQSGGGRGAPRTVSFCGVCLKGSLLLLTLPISIFGVKWWKRYLLGKDRDVRDEATLPDGTTLHVRLGGCFVLAGGSGLLRGFVYTFCKLNAP